MFRDIVKLPLLLAALGVVSGCATGGTAAAPSRSPMISAADFEAMINIEVRELEPLPVDKAMAATH